MQEVKKQSLFDSFLVYKDIRMVRILLLGSIIGPNGDFSSLPDISKWILTVGMILGRLELFAILVLFLPSFWRN